MVFPFPLHHSYRTSVFFLSEIGNLPPYDVCGKRQCHSSYIRRKQANNELRSKLLWEKSILWHLSVRQTQIVRV